jgi:hypothetical protein
VKCITFALDNSYQLSLVLAFSSEFQTVSAFHVVHQDNVIRLRLKQVQRVVLDVSLAFEL